MPRTHLGSLETGTARIHHELCVVAREDRQANNPGRVAQSHALHQPSSMQRRYFRRNGPIRSTARGKMWVALSGTLCIENYVGNAAHNLPRALLQYILYGNGNVATQV
jgi:hypothetical protein